MYSFLFKILFHLKGYFDTQLTLSVEVYAYQYTFLNCTGVLTFYVSTILFTWIKIKIDLHSKEILY